MQWWQIFLLTLYSAYQICDELTIVTSAGSPVFAGFVTGLVMGDMGKGLFIGGSLQLVVLGVGTFGGASRIDATSGAVIATAFSVAKGINPELALSTIAVPVAALLTYADIIGRFSTTYFAHRVDAAVENHDYKAIERNYLLGAIPWALSRALPVFLALWLGGDFVKHIVDFIEANKWVADGMTLASKMLPGLGFAILLHYLPIRRNLHYLALGFGITAMLTTVFTGLSTISGSVSKLVAGFNEKAKAPIDFASGAFDKGLPMIGIAIIGIFVAVIHYKISQKSGTVVVEATQTESGEIEDDEV